MTKKKGRKSKFSEPVRERIIEALRAGTTYEIAAQYAGISRSTLYEWIKKGEGFETGIYRTFYDNLKKAEAEGAVVHLGTISQASRKDWKAAAWLLERRHGYSKAGVNRAEETTKENPLPSSMLDLLKSQAVELRSSMAKAESSQSWQAYAALQRQLLQVVQQIRQIESEEGRGDELDGLTDEQLLTEITSAIVSLPPILRQRLEGTITNIGNIIPMKGAK